MAQIEINIQLSDAIIWHPGTECNFKPDDSVDIWRINIKGNQAYCPGLSTILLPDEVARANRYLQVKDRIRFMVSRIALRQIIGKYTGQPPEAVAFAIGENKKPFINGADLKYNISHSGDWVLIAVSNTAVGVDTEKIDPSFNYKTILEDNFSKKEIDYIGQSAKNFFLLWTRKEALTKATGQGLDENLKYIPCLDGIQYADGLSLLTDKNWLVNSFRVDEENWGTVVSENTFGPSSFFELSLQ